MNKTVMLATSNQPAKMEFTFNVGKRESYDDIGGYLLDVGYFAADKLGDISPDTVGGCRVLSIGYQGYSGYDSEDWIDTIELEGMKFVGKKLKLTNPSGESITVDLKEHKGNARYRDGIASLELTPLEKLIVNFIDTTKTWELEILDGVGGGKPLFCWFLEKVRRLHKEFAGLFAFKEGSLSESFLMLRTAINVPK